MSGVRTRRSSKRSKYEASVADEGPQIFGDMENMNMGTSSESIDDLLEDEVSDTLVLPWRVVKRRLQARITQTTSSSQKASAALPTTLPYGFQISRNLAYPKASIRNALFIPGSPDRFATLDTNFMSIWKNGIRTSKVQLVPPDKNASAPLAGLSKWTYAAKLRALFISTTHLEIKMMTPSFGELGAVSSNKPILSLEYNEFKNELITTGTDNVTVWNFKKTDDVLYPYKFDEIRLHMDDFEEDGWVATTVYNHVNNKILAAAGNAVHVFDYGTGERLELLKEVHELSITAMLVLEPYGYFVTASRDTTIKIFNRQFGLLHELHDHTQAVTGLATVPLPATSGSVASVQSAIPFFLSCSLDGTVKMWNAETGACTYRFDVYCVHRKTLS
ncbi:WD40-repeat-containing domain protein [Fimicolochytrium jonesii]|uniref:WD40-repeat-containing domain protein n=1 Tax=Fimicolochytrium jonesii TaxID=1396493 RepID=UPI0022FEF730|nr:WD40-repeat-containing domain protein [Fimicolochytrium jonesii]KAI8817659.1 WD40-repeat-containing domain protein [Fimicolochytrium jonesii]